MRKKSKSQTKDASKADVSSAESNVVAMNSGLAPTEPVAISHPSAPLPQPATIVQPPVPTPGLPAQPQALPVSSTVTHHHPVTTPGPFPGFPQDMQPHQQVSYLNPMFAHHPTPPGPFGPSSGFENFPSYLQNPHLHYLSVGAYQPTRDDRFSFSTPSPYPTPSTSYSS